VTRPARAAPSSVSPSTSIRAGPGEGIGLTKFWFSVTRAEQRTRFAIALLVGGPEQLSEIGAHELADPAAAGSALS
jgi:hypothetical protein